MSQRVFVKVAGFSDVERHALNTVFRLSEQRDVIYSPWVPEAPEAPKLALIDGESYEAAVDADIAGQNDEVKLVWVGPGAPDNAWRVFERPLHWPDVLQALDAMFAPAVDLDFDLDLGGPDTEPPLDAGPDTQPPDTQPPEPEAPVKRALIVGASTDERLYLRARLSLANLTQADDALSGVEALELLKAEAYAVVMIDLGPQEPADWELVKQMHQVRPGLEHIIITKQGATLTDRFKGWMAGVKGCLPKPPDPARLKDLLERV